MADQISISLISEAPKAFDAMIVPFFQGESALSDWKLNQPPGFNGGVHETLQQYQSDRDQRFFLLGLGGEHLKTTSFRVFRRFAVKNQKQLPKTLFVDMRKFPDPMVFQCALGLALSNYQIGSYKSEKGEKFSVKQVNLLVSRESDALKAAVTEATESASVIKNACALVDAPGNIKSPQYLAAKALEWGKQNGYQVEVLDEEQLKQQGFHALLSVGRGSENGPVLIKAQYNHPDTKASGIDLGLVGKGVTFDTGGISIKKAANMHYMKSDMGGAAAVLGAVDLIARLKLPLNVVAVIPVAENSVDALSIRPGDVIQSFSGKTIEVIDTDAEGRLILADGLSYIQQHYHPATLIDLATLTGSCVAALGYHAAGLFTNRETLAETVANAGDQTGERVWRMPLWKDYEDALDSDIADVKNLSGQPVAGAITAAKFLEYFVDDRQQWAHLDIAGVAFGDTDFGKMKSATGYGVRLLVEFAKTLISR